MKETKKFEYTDLDFFLSPAGWLEAKLQNRLNEGYEIRRDEEKNELERRKTMSRKFNILKAAALTADWYTTPHGLKNVRGTRDDLLYEAREENISELLDQAYRFGLIEGAEKVALAVYEATGKMVEKNPLLAVYAIPIDEAVRCSRPIETIGS